MTPAAATDGAGGVPERQWYVIIVAPRAEKSVREALLRNGIEAYVAARHEIHVWGRGQRKVVEQLLISCTVFVHVAETERAAILQYPRVLYYMMDPARSQTSLGRNRLAVIPDHQMAQLKAMLEQSEFEVAFATADFVIGDKVKLLGFGELELLAEVVRLPEDGNDYVGIRIGCLGCAYMKVPTDRVIRVQK
ncbi:MAG: UpxY family transcription antiterminator [Bacteroidaceae bacterium]|nr:UpxY family transcription antiterminator [Bacteroidaceae bacterium]